MRTYSCFFVNPRHQTSTLFPYTTLFRSSGRDAALHFRGDAAGGEARRGEGGPRLDRKSTRLNSSHVSISYAVFCLKKKKAAHSDLSRNDRLDINGCSKK